MEARRVDAANGWIWIKQGFALFRQNPVLWVVLVMIGMTGLILVASVPVLGDPLATLLFPVLLAGLMVGCRAQEKGEVLELAHLFTGFRQNTTQLVTLGGINLVSQLLILGLMTITGGAALVSLMMNTQPAADPSAVAATLAGGGFALFLGGGLFALLLLAMQYAPMLVMFNGMAPIPALKASLKACLSNVGALAIFGIAIILFGFVASMPMMLGWLILLPVMVTSIYASYCDLFPVENTSSTAQEVEVLPPEDTPST